ncbi:uncharacterized protein LOC134814133 [Bolinopsis microptera]|uniref:uncharacterized protein LOC134814133 n=1 Tax=Bolinopsis microptera TaxID=2820187 RepID=UPI003079BE1E
MMRGVLIGALLVLGVSSVAVQIIDPAKCTLCKAAVSELKVIMEDKDTKDLLGVLKKFVCANVPIQDCDNWVDSELSQLESVVEALDPGAACSQLAVCATTMAPLQDSIQCEFCEFLGDEVVKRVLTSATIDEVVAAAEKVCSELPFVSNECSALVKEYGHFYLDLLVGSIDVQQLCSKIGLCSRQVRDLIESTELFEVIKKGLQDDSPLCAGCQDLLGEVKKAANDPDTIAINKDLAPVICEVISIPFCNSLMTKLLEGTLVKAQNLDVEGTCVALDACSGSVVGMGDVCSDCAQIADLVIKELQDPAVQQQIEAVLDEACSILPIPDCKETLHSYMVIIETLISGMDGKTVCGYAGLCSSKHETVSSYEVSSSVGDTCSECTMIAGELITLLENQQVDAILKGVISEICTVLPISNCETTLDGYFDELVALLKNLDGKTLCSLIGLC